jgi:hypothetical protein
MLWVADSVTWAIGAGGRWRELIRPIVSGVIGIEP